MAATSATRSYSRQAARAAKHALPKLSARAKQCLDLAQEAARATDDNHVGTEHVVLGLLEGAHEIATLLAEIGITRPTFEAQLFDEPGSSPAGTIPMTPRAHQILGFALKEASDRKSQFIEPIHMLLAVIDESDHWRTLREDGPHHLAQAANAVGLTLADIRRAAFSFIKRENASG